MPCRSAATFRRTLAGATLALFAASGVFAAMPYPPNPRPCTDPNLDGPCFAASDFSRFLFLPATEPPTVPNDFNDDWKLTSGTTGNPAIDASPQELFGVRGASVDRAWQVTTGRPDVTIAVLDSGIRWGEALPDLVNKFYLNRRELPVPEGSDTATDPHDRNGDGMFTVPDYLADARHAADSRVSDLNGNGMIDPEDLIFRFSDGVDDDRNGYVDDISGWDFYEDDNDALDEVRYSHGTGQSHDSAAEADNHGELGTCPNCLLLEVRVGDSFVTDVNLFAQGVVFAVDSGARVIQEALGTLNQTRFGQHAIDYAYRNGAVVIASAADEASNHHNYPASYAHTVVVNSVTKFNDLVGVAQTPSSYLYLNGCTNFGGHIALTVPSSSCSSEATGRGAGVAGLVVSAALNAIDRGTLTPYPLDDRSFAPYPLSAEETKQILTLTTDDIDFDARPDAEPPLAQNYVTTSPFPGVRQSQRYPSIAGWDQYFGYGRLNAAAAVARVSAGRIPPEADLADPRWFEVVDPLATPSLPLTGRVAANRAGSYTYTIEVAPGVQPRERDFTLEVASTARDRAFTGTLGAIDIGRLAARMPYGTTGPAVDDTGAPDPDRFTMTIRLRVTDDAGQVGEDRRSIALHHDPDLLPAFPINLGSDGVSAPLTADLDLDGVEEVILGTSDGAVRAFKADRSEAVGWPVFTDPIELHSDSPGFAAGAVPVPVSAAVLGSVAVGDLDRDGLPEVVASDLVGKLYVWTHDGRRRDGFPVKSLPEYSHAWRSERDPSTPDGQVPDRTNRHDADNRVGRAFAAGVVLANLDGSADGSLEIIAGSFDRHVYAWRHTGEPLPGWPVLLKDPAKVAAVDPVTGAVSLKRGAAGVMGTKIIAPPSVGDIDGDGDTEVVAVVNEGYREEPNARFTDPTIGLYRSAGALQPGNTRIYAIHADGVAHGTSPRLRGWNPEAFLPGWPVKTALLTTELLPLVGTGSNGPPALADVDGDGRLEVTTGSAVGPVYVLTASGQSLFGGSAARFATLAMDVLGEDSAAVDAPTFGSLGSPVFAELAGPGEGFQVLAPTTGLGKFIDNQLAALQTPAESHLGVWNVTTPGGQATTGVARAAFPHIVNDLMFFGAPIVADITGDRLPEAIVGSGVSDLHAVDGEGRVAPRWPRFTGGWMVGSAAVGDLDGDGLLEVVAAIRDGQLFAWRTAGDACGTIPWRRFHHDEQGTGNYHADARPPASLTAADITRVYTTAAAGEAPEVHVELARVPGGDLYCGAAAAFEVRFGSAPITSAAAFTTANAAARVSLTERRAGDPGTLVVGDPRFGDGPVHLAMVASDEANNRSAVIALGVVRFAVPAPTPTPTVPAATPAPRREDDGSCQVGAGKRSGWPVLALLAFWLWKRRRAAS